jgi:ABC-2 type transport system permease protein
MIPARYFVSSLQTIFLVGDNWRLLFLNLIPMIAIGALFFIITVRKSVKRLD